MRIYDSIINKYLIKDKKTKLDEARDELRMYEKIWESLWYSDDVAGTNTDEEREFIYKKSKECAKTIEKYNSEIDKLVKGA